jgi:hypothetical protein
MTPPGSIETEPLVFHAQQNPLPGGGMPPPYIRFLIEVVYADYKTFLF